jgi:hypothetical protein
VQKVPKSLKIPQIWLGYGATTLSITTFSIMILSIKCIFETLSKTTFSITTLSITVQVALCWVLWFIYCYAECCILFIVMLSITMLNFHYAECLGAWGIVKGERTGLKKSFSGFFEFWKANSGKYHSGFFYLGFLRGANTTLAWPRSFLNSLTRKLNILIPSGILLP